MNVLVWFRRDLRVADHPALARAAAEGAVLPLYILDPADWAEPGRAGRHWAFLAETLEDLRADLAGCGADLVLRTGGAVAVLSQLCRAYGITRILSHRGAVTAAEIARDAAVADWARGAGVEWIQLEEAAGTAPLPAPGRMAALAGVGAGVLPAPRALRLAEDRCPHRPRGGRAAALDLLARLGPAPEARRLAGLEQGASRLGPYLALGALSLAEVRAVPGLGRGLRNRLGLRAAALGAGPVEMPEAGDVEGVVLRALAEGETGLPFLDAAMRYLRAGGWLPEALRACAGALAVQQLGLPMQAVGALLSSRFLDAEPAILWPALAQAVARPLSGEALPRLAARLDPGAQFTRAWLPELAAVPEGFLHQPWKWEGASRLLGRRYPEPLIDPVSAARVWRAGCAVGPQAGGARGGALRRGRVAEGQLQLAL